MSAVPKIPRAQSVAAVERACRAWRCLASVTRNDARANGVTGHLPTLDKMANGSRGRSGPTQLTQLAREMRSAGIPRADATERLRGMADMIAALVYHDEAESTHRTLAGMRRRATDTPNSAA